VGLHTDVIDNCSGLNYTNASYYLLVRSSLSDGHPYLCDRFESVRYGRDLFVHRRNVVLKIGGGVPNGAVGRPCGVRSRREPVLRVPLHGRLRGLDPVCEGLQEFIQTVGEMRHLMEDTRHTKH
jgi:hypothetical protein